MLLLVVSLLQCIGVARSALKDIPLHVRQAWNELPWSERLPYLIDKNEYDEKFYEFHKYGAADRSECVPRASFYRFLDEFQGEDEIEKFWRYCDENRNDEVCFDEYMYCRGQFDQSGNTYGFNEYEYREKLLFSESENEEEVMMEEEYNSNNMNNVMFVLDEDGIIVDR
jgi:hypothetical protein